MIQKFIIPQKIKIDPNSTPKPQTINLDLKPYNKRNKEPYNNPHNIHLHASTPHLILITVMTGLISSNNHTWYQSIG